MKLILATLVMTAAASCVITNNLEIPFGSDKIQESFVAGDREAQPIVAFVQIHGGIASDGSAGVVPMQVRKVLNTIRGKSRVVGVILDINSPGGSGAASEEVFQMLQRFKKETDLPVHAYVSEIAASGGYYIAIAADKITGNPGAITGSIGVISVFFNIEKLLDNKLEVDVVTIKTGKFKDSGSMYRSLRPEEREYWQNMINHFYGKFVNRVSTARKLEVNAVQSLADGRVFHVDDAVKFGLVDGVGTLDDVIDDLRKETGFNRLKVVHFGRSDSGFGLFQSAAPDPFAWLTKKALDPSNEGKSPQANYIGQPLWYSPSPATQLR